MSLFDIYKAKKLGANAGSLFDVVAGKNLKKDTWKKGFNKWDEEWETGSIDSSNGKNETSSSHWRTKNFIPVNPNTTYYIYSETEGHKAMRMRYYDANKNYIGITSGEGITNVLSNGQIIPPENCYYVRFAPATETIPSHKICFNVSGEHDGEYVPYNG